MITVIWTGLILLFIIITVGFLSASKEHKKHIKTPEDKSKTIWTNVNNLKKLNISEKEKFDKFKKDHCSMVQVFSTETGIGPSYNVKCHHCGAEEDITDYNCW